MVGNCFFIWPSRQYLKNRSVFVLIMNYPDVLVCIFSNFRNKNVNFSFYLNLYPGHLLDVLFILSVPVGIESQWVLYIWMRECWLSSSCWKIGCFLYICVVLQTIVCSKQRFIWCFLIFVTIILKLKFVWVL